MIRWLLGHSDLGFVDGWNAMRADHAMQVTRHLLAGEVVKDSKRVVGNRETERIIREREARAAAMGERPRLRRVS